ncbi:LysR substrate-binding domain-containing protein, partial [Actinocorallia lasiicapitis]
ADHGADVVLAGRPPEGLLRADGGVTVLARRPNELIVVTAPRIAFDHTTPWVLREPGSGTRVTADAYLAEHEASPPKLVLGSNGAVVAGAAAGLGAALVSREAVRDDLSAGRLIEAAALGMPLSRPWHAVTGATPTATTRLFAEELTHHGWSEPPRT